jgi:cupin fold WbuC family metalloprotein
MLEKMEQPFPVQLLTDSLIQSVVEKAKHSPRLRMNHNFHGGPEDNPHRFLNVFIYGTYVTPHRHKNPPKAESFIVLDGYIAVFVFNDNGVLDKTIVLGSGSPPPRIPVSAIGGSVARGIDLPPGLWHSITALTPHAVTYEVKPGPWNPSTDKEFAPWAPQEGDASASDYLQQLLR